ncbi:hypothetical protein H1V43_31050 [Streptomyces sp. PSKA54]|uniref:Lipoprotein n=1 Tax=Streptomyces himalayensis subsp. aureolus TaxID=2758039 RepID=A0A7W2D6R2_9ACTN|nr:hypothetical protein [Streptomyces himalayensis]MBA4865703.1 hypothetical protein [Streptomyces himalayensis subsp. aureolus]
MGVSPSPFRRWGLVGTMCAGLVAVGGALTGCGSEDPDAGTNGVGKLSATQIQAKTRKAAEAAASLRLSGKVVVSGRTYKLDMRLKDEGGSGSVTTKGSTFWLLRVGAHLYLKADAQFWTQDEGADDESAGAADKLDGMYVKVPQGDPSYKQLSGFTDKDVLLDGLLSLHGTLAKGDHGTADGARTIEITGDKGAGGTLAVSLEGKPYPLLLERAGNAGTLELSEWGKEFKLQEPTDKQMVDYGKQLPRS